MKYIKKEPLINTIYTQWWCLVRSIDQHVYNPSELLDWVILQELCNQWWYMWHTLSQKSYTFKQFWYKKQTQKDPSWYKSFSKYPIQMDYTTLDYWYCRRWIDHWLWKNNILSDEFLEIVSKEFTTRQGVNAMINRLIKGKLIARLKKGVYVLNPNIAYFVNQPDISIYNLFK